MHKAGIQLSEREMDRLFPKQKKPDDIDVKILDNETYEPNVDDAGVSLGVGDDDDDGDDAVETKSLKKIPNLLQQFENIKAKKF